MKTIVIKSQFGHEIMAVNFAKAFNLDVVIAPNKDEKKAYDEESDKIFRNMSFFYDRMSVVPFEEKDNLSSWDIIAELKAGKLDNSLWEKFAASRLIPANTNGLPTYPGMSNRLNTLFIPQKLISDGECGITAEQQSLPLAVFEFLKNKKSLVLGQHFNKVNDIEAVRTLARDFDLYVPGLTENPEVLGIRGIQHKAYYNMYARLNASIGIAGTHTWILLTMFPEVPQVILYYIIDPVGGAENMEGNRCRIIRRQILIRPQCDSGDHIRIYSVFDIRGLNFSFRRSFIKPDDTNAEGADDVGIVLLPGGVACPGGDAKVTEFQEHGQRQVFMGKRGHGFRRLPPDI